LACFILETELIFDVAPLAQDDRIFPMEFGNKEREWKHEKKVWRSSWNE